MSVDAMEQLLKQVTILNQELVKEKGRYVGLKREWEKLNKAHSTLEEEYNSLVDDYESLILLYEEELWPNWEE